MRYLLCFMLVAVASPVFATVNVLQDFEDGVLWEPGDGDDTEGYNRGWELMETGGSAEVAIETGFGANGTNNCLKVTMDSGGDQIYFKSESIATDHMPEAEGMDRMSFYIKFPAGFPVQTSSYPYRTFQLGTYIHDPDNFASGTVRHFYHHLTMEFTTAEGTGNGWVKFIVDLQPDQEVDETGTPAPLSYYFDEFGRWYFEFGSDAGGPSTPTEPWTFYIDEIKFYTDDEDQAHDEIHTGGSADAGFDGDYQVRVGASGEDFTNLEAAIADIPGSGSVIITDGTYSGSTNILDHLNMPPSGASGDPTKIVAENDGGAIFPDSFIMMEDSATVSHVDFIGLKAESATSVSTGTSHFRFFRCAFTSTNSGQTDHSTFAISGTYHLVEDCWAWGEGRYGMFTTNSTATDHIIFRRCVVRMDKLNAYSPIAALHTYGVSQVAFQNCIVLDGDDRFWLNYEEKGPAYYNHNAPVDVYVDGSIAINYPSYFSGGTPGTNFVIRNSAAFDIANGLIIDMKNTSQDDFNVDQVTVWNTDSIGIQGRNIVGGTWPVTNSIMYENASIGLNGWGVSSDYNVFYNNGTDYVNPTPGTHDYTGDNSNAIDPSDGTPGNGTACVLHPPRIEAGSNCDGTGAGGSDRGASIMYKIGTSGTVWGETGWDTVTSDELWPFPNEDRIKTDMASYSYTGVDADGTANQTLSGARGFAASGTQLNGTDEITLTSYIWEYLGNQMPTDIYSGEAVTTYYKDSDGDGYSDGATATTVTTGYYLSSELTATSGDCDDTDAAFNPGATQVCGNGLDEQTCEIIDDTCSTVSGTVLTYGGVPLVAPVTGYVLITGE